MSNCNFNVALMVEIISLVTVYQEQQTEHSGLVSCGQVGVKERRNPGNVAQIFLGDCQKYCGGRQGMVVVS